MVVEPDEFSQCKTQLWQAFSLLELVKQAYSEDQFATLQTGIDGILNLMNTALCNLEEMEKIQ